MPGPLDPATIEAIWREVLVKGHKHRLAVLPSSPRCVGCQIPFGGIGGRVSRALGHRPSKKNPNFCNLCDDLLPAGGAEIDIAVVFADIRGSTDMGERLGPSAFAALLNRYYKAASEVIFKHGATLDKMVGDEVMALLYPLSNGPEYERVAVEMSIDILRAVGYGGGKTPWVPVGIGIQAGPAYVGRVGTNETGDFTALGDTVNTAARLRDEAKAGEIVVGEGVYKLVADLFPDAEAREVALQGKAEKLSIRTLKPTV